MIATTFSTISFHDKISSVTTVVELKLVDLIQCRFIVVTLFYRYIFSLICLFGWVVVASNVADFSQTFETNPMLLYFDKILKFVHLQNGLFSAYMCLNFGGSNQIQLKLCS